MGDYGVTIAILAFTGVAFAFKRHGDTAVPTLAIPSEFAPTWVNPETGKARSWFVNPLGINKDFPPWAVFGTMVPALGLTFLGYMDQNLTSILINRKDHALRKPPAYHLDLFVCGAVVYPVCALLGQFILTLVWAIRMTIDVVFCSQGCRSRTPPPFVR